MSQEAFREVRRTTLRRFIALRYPVVDSSLEDVSVSANE
jgi:hypothetical protein